MSDVVQIMKTEVFEDVPVLKFIEDHDVVVLFKGRPVIADLQYDNDKYDDKTCIVSCYRDVNGILAEGPKGLKNALENSPEMYHVAAFPGTVAKLTVTTVKINGDSAKYYNKVYNGSKDGELFINTYVASDVKMK